MKKKILTLVFCAVLIFGFAFSANAQDFVMLNGLEPEYYIALESESDGSVEQEEAMLLGSLSAKYESNGKPETISSGADTGKASYGAYQFSSRYGVPLQFAAWCISSGEGVEIGERLNAAYALDQNTYGENFNAEWVAIAAEDSAKFLVLQHNYTKAQYYDVLVAKLEAQVEGFKIENYTLALKNVIWSRAVQHGVNADVVFKAFESLGGFDFQNEDVLIRAIYAQSSLLTDTAPYEDSVAIEQSSAEKYGIAPETVAGKYLYYFSRNSSDIQVSVYRRLAVRELEDALAMFVSYGGVLTEQPTEPEQPSEPESSTEPESTTEPSSPLVPIDPPTTEPEDSTQATEPSQPSEPTRSFFGKILDWFISFFNRLINLF